MYKTATAAGTIKIMGKILITKIDSLNKIEASVYLDILSYGIF
jgi:hypothetical protein